METGSRQETRQNKKPLQAELLRAIVEHVPNIAVRWCSGGVQIAGLAALGMAVEWIDAPSAMILALVLTIFGYGQGLVMAPLSSAVPSTVKPLSAGAASGIYGTTAQIANAAGVAAIGAVFFAIESNQSSRLALLAACALFALSIIACAAFLTWMRRVTG